METVSRAKIRNALRTRYGKRNYRIDRNNQVYVYGPKPSSQIICWWQMGDIIDAELWLGFHDRIVNGPNGDYWIPSIQEINR